MRSITIIGAGIGGLAAAAALHQRGVAVAIYEQADRFARVGAGIQQSPNAVRVLHVKTSEENWIRYSMTGAFHSIPS